MKVIITISTMILFVMTGCGGGNKQSTDDFITVDVTASYPKKELILQNFLDVEYIPLETTEEFITFGYVQAVGKDIILVRNTNKAGIGNIFIFDRTGKGLRKINRRGQGNEEYANITGLINLGENNGEMFVNCYQLRKIFVYDLSGNFKRSLRYKEGGEGAGIFKSDVGYNPIGNFDRDHLICQDGSSARNFNRDSEDMEPRNIFCIVSKQDGSVTREIKIPFEKKVSQMLFSNAGIGVVNNPCITPYRDHWLLTEPSADTIYRYSPDHIMKPFIVRTPSVQSMKPEIFLFPGVITDQYYFLQTVKKELDETKKDFYDKLLRIQLVYDRQEKELSECVVYNDDFVNKRPIKNLTDEILELTVVNNEEIAFAEKIEAGELIEAYEADKLKGKLKEIAAGLHEESNPVIMLAKYKR